MFVGKVVRMAWASGRGLMSVSVSDGAGDTAATAAAAAAATIEPPVLMASRFTLP